VRVCSGTDPPPGPVSNRGSTAHFQTTTPSRSRHTSTSERASVAGLCHRPPSYRPKGVPSRLTSTRHCVIISRMGRVLPASDSRQRRGSAKSDLSVVARPAIAALYQRLLLDPVVEVALAIAHDCAKRPCEYRQVPERVLATLSDFRTLTESHPEWPSAAQRASIYAPLFGQHFRRAGSELRGAATRAGAIIEA